jgi:hypothetical protein
MTDRSVLNSAPLANSSDIQSSETVSASQSQTRGEAAQPNRTSDVDLPMVSQSGTKGITLEREAASAAEKDGSSDSDGLSTGLARRMQFETAPPSNESTSTGSAPINVAHSSISSSAIIQKQQAPAEFVYLKRYDIRRAGRRNPGAQSELAPARSASFDREDARSSADNAVLTRAVSPLSPSTLTALNPEAPPAKPAATELSRQQISHLPAPLVLRKGSADAAASMEESPARSPIQQPLAATGRQARDEVAAIRAGTETDLPGNASSHRRPATAELIERQLNHAAEPLILRQIRSDAANMQEETVPDASSRRPLSAEAQDPDLLKFSDRTATKLSGGEAVHPNIDSSSETVVTESFVSQHLPRPAPSLLLSSAAASASKGTALPLVFLESSQTQRAVQRSSKVKAGAAPLVAPEMRAESDQAAPPGIVWRKSTTTQRDASLPVTQMTAGVLVARQANGSSAAGGLPVAQSPESTVSHSNGDNHNGGGIDVEHLIRVLHKRLAIERERRGIGR